MKKLIAAWIVVCAAPLFAAHKEKAPLLWFVESKRPSN